MPQPATPAGKGDHDEDKARTDLGRADFQYNEDEDAAEDELQLDSDTPDDDWFGDDEAIDDLGAGDDDFDADEDGDAFDDEEETFEEDEAGELYADEPPADEDDALYDDVSAGTPLLDTVAATIAEHQLFDPAADTVLVAVSGGKDSVVLLDVLHRLGVRLAVAHAHFGLRAEDADADAEFVRKLAKKLSAPFHLEHFATKQFAQQTGASVQMAARALRYAWFGRLCRDHGYAAVATAHHRADLTETMLLNLTRGTGLAGLHGIPVSTPLPDGGRVVRPLLACTLDDLYDYLATHPLTWREDSSNQERTYRRNRLRHDVLPVLRDLNPNLEQTLALTAERVQQAEALVSRELGAVREAGLRVTPEASYLSVAPLQNTPATALLLGELLRPYGFDYGQSRAVAAALGGVSGTRFESLTHRLVIDRGQLVITPRDLRPFGTFALEAGATELKLTGGKRLLVKHLPADGYRPPRNPNVGAFDAATLRFPLTVRPWQPGDWLIPLGMRGKQKVSDVLINAKVPANLKDRVLVVVNANGSIIWVAGQRIDDRFKVTPQTTDVVELALV